MFALVLFLASLVQAPAAALVPTAPSAAASVQSAPAAAATSAPSDVHARLHPEPSEAQIGQPVAWALEVEAPQGSTILLPEKDPAFDSAWALLEPRRTEREQRDGLEHATLRWKLAALEPGERSFGALEIAVETKNGRVVLHAEPEALHVLPALKEGEDAPRAQRGFLPPPAAATPRGWIVLGVLLALLAAGTWLVIRRRRRAPEPVALPGVLQRFAEAEQRFAQDPERARESVFALTALLRERCDAWLDAPRAALTDEDWSAALQRDERVPLGVKSASARLLARASEVKYALATPTRFAVDEMFADTRAVLETLEGTPAPDAAPAPVEVAA